MVCEVPLIPNMLVWHIKCGTPRKIAPLSFGCPFPPNICESKCFPPSASGCRIRPIKTATWNPLNPKPRTCSLTSTRQPSLWPSTTPPNSNNSLFPHIPLSKKVPSLLLSLSYVGLLAPADRMTTAALRSELALKAFTHTADYDTSIAGGPIILILPTTRAFPKPSALLLFGGTAS